MLINDRSHLSAISIIISGYLIQYLINNIRIPNEQCYKHLTEIPLAKFKLACANTVIPIPIIT